MRKRLCLLLICWLPCFVMAANVMSFQMALAEQVIATNDQTQAMPCHHMAAHSTEADGPAGHDSTGDHAPASHHACTVCGFCVMSTGVARLDAFPRIAILTQSAAVPLFAADPVHSQTYPPAIKPPIFS
jgi:hypothetical protein